ncbi:MAG: hypothetical protein ACYDEO_24615, partial [Aggregatilineales bacterium]
MKNLIKCARIVIIILLLASPFASLPLTRTVASQNVSFVTVNDPTDSTTTNNCTLRFAIIAANNGASYRGCYFGGLATASFTFVLFDQTTFGSGTVQIPLTSQLEVSSFIQINPPSSLT